MADYIHFDFDQGIKSRVGNWYKCIQHLGTGGNAVTYLVLSTTGQNKGMLFALKVFRKLSQPARRERFLNEITFLLTCDHPALMRVVDSGEFNSPNGEFPFVVAEYLPQRLFDIMRAGDATIAQRLAYILQLLSALSYLSTRTPQVVHRDIKPQNAFVKGRSCVLGDFGLMKLLDGNVEEDQEIFKESVGPGMPFFYRTPDLIAYAKGEGNITTKSDVFQLGLVAAELFSGWNPAQRPKEHLDPLVLDPISHIPGGLGASIAAQIKRMLNFDPVARPDAASLLDPWQSVFQAASSKAHELDGKVL